SSDPCDNGANALGDQAVTFDEWVRERAGIRNLCFEVWKPGVTDTDNPDYWKILNVQVHWRWHGQTQELGWAYVPSIDRRGNNRRYAWSLPYDLDPFMFGRAVPAITVPFHIDREANGWAEVSADLEVTFTVNGQLLQNPSHHPFVVHYEGGAPEPTLAASDT